MNSPFANRRARRPEMASISDSKSSKWAARSQANWRARNSMCSKWQMKANSAKGEKSSDLRRMDVLARQFLSSKGARPANASVTRAACNFSSSSSFTPDRLVIAPSLSDASHPRESPDPPSTAAQVRAQEARRAAAGCQTFPFRRPRRFVHERDRRR